ncbi:MAG TPA: hypothetical protein DCS12_11805 [Clostridiales bacterium]|nr:hypothetical protein [Clostridiales bacterium]
MIKYLDKFVPSMSEINNSPTLLIHSLCSCNFHCYNCLNYDELILKQHLKYFNIDDITKFLQHWGALYSYIALSGGEFLLNNTQDIISDVKAIQKVFHGKIIVYTNGTQPQKIFDLKDIVDGFHTDMKLPYHLLQLPEDNELINAVVGRTLSKNDIDNLLLSIQYTIQYNKGYNQIRSVSYPMLDASAFKENEKYLKSISEQYKNPIEYKVNTFVPCKNQLNRSDT